MKGVNYPLHPIAKNECLVDLQANFNQGNHKSTTMHMECLTNMLKDKVEHGWELLLPKEAALHLPQTVLAPLGLVEQDTINEFREIVPKWQLIHDQSFNMVKGTSRLVNNRLLMDKLTPCQYGQALLHHIHVIVGMQLQNPS
jgi:hypothetical protein